MDEGLEPHTALRAALRRSEARLQDLIDLSSDWYWEQDAQLRFTYFSKVLRDKTGLSEALHLGKTRWDVPALNLTPDDWKQHRAVLARREPFHDFVICRPLGSDRLHWVSVSGRPVFGDDGEFIGYRGTGRDITEAREREEALLRFRAAVDATADGIHIVDSDTMCFIDVNDTACRYLGYSRDEFLRLSIADIAPEVDMARLRALYGRLFSGEDGEQAAEIMHRHRDGRRIPIEIRRRGTAINGRRIVVNVVRDITANKKTEQTIRHHALAQGLIATLGHQALAGSDVEALIARAIDVVRAGLDVPFAAVLQASPDDPAWHSTIEAPIAGTGGEYGRLAAGAADALAFTQENVDFLKSVANILASAMDRRATETRLTYMAQFDALTGLPNRTLFLDRFGQVLNQAKRNHWLIGAVFIDLDRFKLVNDTLGHSCGDQLLIQVAKRLAECVRSGDTVGRLSGDEFALVLSGLARADDAALVAQKVVTALARPFRLGGQDVYVSASLGIAVYPADGADPEALLRNADTAMYRAKERGRNGYQFYLPQMNERALERLQMETQLRVALERDELVLHYQPKASLATGRISGFEALLRWQHPQRGLVGPDDFIPLLEDTGLIVPIGEWVVRSACEQLARWRDEGVPLRPVAVNLSARQFQQKDLDADIAAILRETGVDPGLLELELTESMLMHEPHEAAAMLGRMKAAGLRLSIDDFGTGWSSLAQLERFPLDALKIDRGFIRDVGTAAGDGSIARAIINLAHSLKLAVVGEGVETAAQLAFLDDHGCDEVQGFLFARPLAAHACTRLLSDDHRLPR